MPGSPSCTRESSSARNGGDPYPLGRASLTPLSLASTPGQTREGTRGSGFHRFPGSLSLGCPSSPNPGAPASRSPALSPPGRRGATIRLGAYRAAPSLAALAVVRAVLVQGALLHTVRSWFELGAHSGFLCSRALGWVGTETCQGEPSPVPPAYPLPAPRSPNFNPKDFGFSGPGAAITSYRRTSPPGQGSLTLESPQSSASELLLGGFGHPGSFPLLFIRSLLSAQRTSAPPTLSLHRSRKLQYIGPQTLSFKDH